MNETLRLPKGLQKLLETNRHQIDDIETAEDGGFETGYRVNLRPGWLEPIRELHSIWGATVKDVKDQIKWLEVCHCSQCFRGPQ